jgi:TBC domain-containing protein kinase-like protein
VTRLGTELIECLFSIVSERLLVVSDHYEKNLESVISEKPLFSCEQIQQWAHQILHALIYLQEKQLHSRNLSLKNIRLTTAVNSFAVISSASFLSLQDQAVKIQNYGLWHMTQYGACVSFPIGYLCFP